MENRTLLSFEFFCTSRFDIKMYWTTTYRKYSSSYLKKALFVLFATKMKHQ